VSYGVGRAYPGYPAGSLVRLDRPLSVAGQAGDPLYCCIHQGPVFAPPGKAVVQATFTTEYGHWVDLQRSDRTRYEAEKKQVAAQVLECLEGLLPGIASAVEMTDVATPYTWQRYTRNYRGVSKGWLITPRHAGQAPFRALPKTLPGLENFCMAGHWVEPGGGVPQVLLSGRQAVQIVCRWDRVPFVTATP
jgi:phytoene desaturase